MSLPINYTLEECSGEHIYAATKNGIFIEGRMNRAGQIENGENPIQLYTEQNGKIVLNPEFNWAQLIWDEKNWTTISADLACVGDALVINNELYVIQELICEMQYPIAFVVRDRINTKEYTVSMHMVSLALRLALPDKQGVYKTDNGTVVIRTKDHWELFDKKFNNSVELDDNELRAYLCNKGKLHRSSVISFDNKRRQQ